MSNTDTALPASALMPMRFSSTWSARLYANGSALFAVVKSFDETAEREMVEVFAV